MQGHGGDEALGLLEGQGEDDVVGEVVAVGAAEEPAGDPLLDQLFDAGTEFDLTAMSADEVGGGGVEVAERDGGDAEAAAGSILEEELVKDFAGIAHGAVGGGVVEGGEDERLPQMADGAVGLAGAAEPLGDGFGVGLLGSVGEAHEGTGDGELVGQAEHGRAQKAAGELQRRGQRADGDGGGADGASGGCGFEPGLAVVPADFIGEAGLVAEVDEVGAAADEDVLGVDDLVERGMQIGVGATADVGAAFEHRDGDAVLGEGDGCGKAGDARSHDDDFAGELGCSGAMAHPVPRGHDGAAGEDGEFFGR